MPTSRESVPNTALSGDEFKEVIRTRCDQLLANFGILAPNLAFGRVAFTITISLHVDNAMQPEHSTFTASRRIATNVVSGNPALAAIEEAPLASPSPDAVVISRTADAKVDSPNAERVRLGLPVPVVVKSADGTRTVEKVKYPADESLGKGDIAIRDSSDEARRAWGLPEPAMPESPVDPVADAFNAAAPVYEADPLGNGDNR